MLGDGGLSIASQLLGVIQSEINFPMLACHIPDGSDNQQKMKH